MRSPVRYDSDFVEVINTNLVESGLNEMYQEDVERCIRLVACLVYRQQFDTFFLLSPSTEGLVKVSRELDMESGSEDRWRRFLKVIDHSHARAIRIRHVRL